MSAHAVSPDALPARLLALSTLQILATSTTFTSVRPSPLATLTHVTTRYIELLAESAKANAEQGGRTTCTGWDVVGVLEGLDGPGAVEGLFGWCRENLKRQVRRNTDGQHVNGEAKEEKGAEEAARLSDVAKVLEAPSLNLPPAAPTAKLSFLRLSEEEIAALDRAGESDLDDSDSSMDVASPAPKPSAQSSSDSEDSDSDSEVSPSPPPTRPLEDAKATLSSASVVADTVEPKLEDEGLWRSRADIPTHVPFFLPPFPGLEKVGEGPAAGPSRTQAQKRDAASAGLEAEEVDEAAARTSLPAPTTSALQQRDPYHGSMPFASSMLNDAGSAPTFPRLRTPTPSPPAELGSGDEAPPMPSVLSSRKRRREGLPGSLPGFVETVSTLVNPRIAPPQPPYLPQQPARRRVAALIDTPEFGGADTLSAASILPAPYRRSRRTAGWLPYSTSILPEMKPFASVLPISVTTPVPDSGSSPYPVSFVGTAGTRNPSTIPSLLKQLSVRDPKDDAGFQSVAARITRTGPPAPLGEQGEALPYVVEPPTQTASGAVGETRYLEWGFEWQGISPQDPLPPSRAEQPAMKVPPMPPMPKLKTNEDRERERLEKQRKGSGMGLVLKLGGTPVA